jgi:hypothetical protein
MDDPIALDLAFPIAHKAGDNIPIFTFFIGARYKVGERVPLGDPPRRTGLPSSAFVDSALQRVSPTTMLPSRRQGWVSPVPAVPAPGSRYVWK